MQIYENETHFPVVVCWLKNNLVGTETRLLVQYVKFWELYVENPWRHEFIQIKSRSYDYFWNWHYWKFVLRIKEILFLGIWNVKISWGGMPPDPPRRERLWRSIITIRLLRNVCQLLEKLWTTLGASFTLFAFNGIKWYALSQVQ